MYKQNTASIVVAILFFTCGVSAQDNASNIRLGLIANLEKNISSENIVFDQYRGITADYDKTNYQVGVALDYNLGEKSSINTAIKYANKDFTGTYYCEVCDFEVPPSRQTIDFSFIEVPVTVQYYFLQNRLKPFAAAGITNLFLLDEAAVLNSYALSATVEGGLEYSLTEQIALQAAIDYNQGVSNLFKESDYKLKTVAFEIGIMTSL